MNVYNFTLRGSTTDHRTLSHQTYGSDLELAELATTLHREGVLILPKVSTYSGTEIQEDEAVFAAHVVTIQKKKPTNPGRGL